MQNHGSCIMVFFFLTRSLFPFIFRSIDPSYIRSSVARLFTNLLIWTAFDNYEKKLYRGRISIRFLSPKQYERFRLNINSHGINPSFPPSLPPLPDPHPSVYTFYELNSSMLSLCVKLTIRYSVSAAAINLFSYFGRLNYTLLRVLI